MSTNGPFVPARNPSAWENSDLKEFNLASASCDLSVAMRQRMRRASRAAGEKEVSG